MNSKNLVSLKRNLLITKLTLLSQFSKFRKYYFEHYNQFPDSVFHKDISVLLDDFAKKRGNKLAVAAPRGSAKSTLITLQYVIFCIAYKLENFILIISNTSDQAQSFLTNIKYELEGNKELARDFPDACETGKKPAPYRWTKKEIITKKTYTTNYNEPISNAARKMKLNNISALPVVDEQNKVLGIITSEELM